MISGLKPAYYIPLPTPYERARGIDATSGPNWKFIQFKGIKAERDKIHRAAEIVGVSAATFMRCIINDFADNVIRDYEAQQVLNRASETSSVSSLTEEVLHTDKAISVPKE